MDIWAQLCRGLIRVAALVTRAAAKRSGVKKRHALPNRRLFDYELIARVWAARAPLSQGRLHRQRESQSFWSMNQLGDAESEERSYETSVRSRFARTVIRGALKTKNASCDATTNGNPTFPLYSNGLGIAESSDHSLETWTFGHSCAVG